MPARRGLRAVPRPESTALPDMPMETKLHAPSLRRELVERRSLISVLAASTARLVLIEAPAGFGKTTLAAQWRASMSEKRRFAWVCIDRGDDDPGRLWWHITHALQRACPGLDVDEVLRALRAPVPDITGTVIPLLVQELAVSQAPVVLVLDDYQLIKEPSRHEQTAFLLLHLPPSAQIALVTRTGPPLPLARLRAAGEMVEIRMPELRLEPAEGAALVRNVSGLELAEPDLADLLERTEGWPAGLYLAALSLRGHPSPSAFIRHFTGDNRFIVDFLAEEVLADSRATSGSSSRGRPFSTGSARRFATRLPGLITGRRSLTPLSARTSSSCLLTTTVSGTAITICSRKCFAASWPGPSRASSRLCTSTPAHGIGGADQQTRRSVTRSPAVILAGPSTSLRAIG